MSERVKEAIDKQQILINHGLYQMLRKHEGKEGKQTETYVTYISVKNGKYYQKRSCGIAFFLQNLVWTSKGFTY